MPLPSDIVSFLLIQRSDSILRWGNPGFFTQSHIQPELKNRIAKLTKLHRKLPEFSKIYLSALPRSLPVVMLIGRIAQNEELEQISSKTQKVSK